MTTLLINNLTTESTGHARPDQCEQYDTPTHAKGIRVVGTLGLLLRSKQVGLLDAVEPTLSAMMALGLRVSRELVDATPELAGEK